VYLTGRGDMQVQGALAGHAEYVRRYNFQCSTARSVRYPHSFTVFYSDLQFYILCQIRATVYAGYSHREGWVLFHGTHSPVCTRCVH
jgi:hypothetical protein